jgi:hypothetical protein
VLGKPRGWYRLHWRARRLGTDAGKAASADEEPNDHPARKMILMEYEARTTTTQQDLNEEVEKAEHQLALANDEEEDALEQVTRAQSQIHALEHDLATVKPKELARRTEIETAVTQARETASTAQGRADKADLQRGAAKVKLAALEKGKPLADEQVDRWREVLALTFDNAYYKARNSSSPERAL